MAAAVDVNFCLLQRWSVGVDVMFQVGMIYYCYLFYYQSKLLFYKLHCIIALLVLSSWLMCGLDMDAGLGLG